MTTDKTPRQLTETEFDEQFTVVPEHDGQLVRDRMPGSDPQSRCLWTIVESDDGGDLYAVPGVHYVNRIGYIVTEETWTEAIVCAEWDVRDPDDHSDEEPSEEN